MNTVRQEENLLRKVQKIVTHSLPSRTTDVAIHRRDSDFYRNSSVFASLQMLSLNLGRVDASRQREQLSVEGEEEA